jgi:hypothetical protein
MEVVSRRQQLRFSVHDAECADPKHHEPEARGSRASVSTGRVTKIARCDFSETRGTREAESEETGEGGVRQKPTGWSWFKTVAQDRRGNGTAERGLTGGGCTRTRKRKSCSPRRCIDGPWPAALGGAIRASPECHGGTSCKVVFW